MGIGRWFRSLSAKLVFLLVLAAVGLGAWFALPDPMDPENVSAASASPARPARETAFLAEATGEPVLLVSEQAMATPIPDLSEAPSAAPSESVTAERAPIDGLRISSQTWRRGGLGSKALVTLTLRNANDYAVKDIEIACAFARADGSHVTDRKRVINDTISMKSRKTYAGMLIGFININANKAKCSLVTASRV